MTSALWHQTGGIWPLGVSCSLTWYDLGAIVHVIQTHHIRSVVEIGVEHGGLAAFLLAYAALTPLDYYGIDLHLSAMDQNLWSRHAHQFAERDAWNGATVAEVGRWLAAHEAPALIFCDGGDKPRELRLYAPLLRSGDVLMGHDYHNEYVDDALAAMPPTVEQLRADWLDDGLICMFQRRGG